MKGASRLPGDGAGPPIWLLGSSGYSARLAGMLGLPFAMQRWEGQAVGSVETVRRALGDLLAATAADELMVTTMVPDLEARLRSMTLLRGLVDTAELPQGLVAA